MTADRTAVLTIWPTHAAVTGGCAGGQYALRENFRPTWTRTAGPRTQHSLTSLPEAALVTVLAGHLGADRLARLGVTLPSRCTAPLVLDPATQAAVLRAFAGRSLSLLRYDYCCLRDDELSLARDAGVHLEVWDMLTGERAARGQQ